MRSLTVPLMLGAVSYFGSANAADELPRLESAEVRSGLTIYERYCASCHGANAQGAPNWQQRDQQGELPSPPHDSEGHTWRHSDAELYKMVSEGWRDPFNRTERLTMPAFHDVLSPRQIRAVIIYLKTLWTPEQRAYQYEQSRGRSFPPEGE